MRLARCLIARFDGNDAVCVDIERDFDLRYSARCRCDADKFESAERLVVASKLSLTLQNMNVNCRLVVRSGAEHLRFACRNCRVSVNEFCANAAERFDAERQRSYVKKKHIFHFACEHAALNCSTDCNTFVRVDSLIRIFAGDLLDGVVHCRHTSRAADHDDFCNVVVRKSCVFECLLHRALSCLDEIFGERIEFRTSEFHIKVHRHTVLDCDERKRDVCFGDARKVNLCFFCRFFDTLHCHLVAG